MLEEERLNRQLATEHKIGQLSYERIMLDRQIKDREVRKSQIDLELAECEGALRESERSRLDIQTQAAITAAKQATKESHD